MLSWQRISALARKSPGPLFFFGETETEEPVVVLSLRAYESMLSEIDSEKPPVATFPSSREVDGVTEQAIQVPVRIETVETRPSSEDVLRRSESLSPDLLKGSEMIITPVPEPSPAPIPAPIPVPIEEKTSLEERFYFATPLE